MLAVAVLALCTYEVQADVIHSTWVGGEYGLWSNASNWNPHTVPDNSDWRNFAVTISGDVHVDLDINPIIDSLDTYGDVDLYGYGGAFAWLVVGNGFNNHGSLEIKQVAIEGPLTNITGARLELWYMDIAGTLYNRPGAKIEVYGPPDVDRVENSGLVTIFPSGTLYVAGEGLLNSGQIELRNGLCQIDSSLFENTSTGLVTGSGIICCDQQIRNEGIIYGSAGSLVVQSNSSLSNTGTLANKALSTLHVQTTEYMNNFGTIEVNAGGGVVFDCNLVNVQDPNATIRLLGGTLAAMTITQSADATFEGFGGITGDVVIDPNGVIKLTGPTNIVGDVNITANATLEVSDGTTLITGHTTNNGDIRVVNGDVIFQGGYSGSGLVQKD